MLCITGMHIILHNKDILQLVGYLLQINSGEFRGEPVGSLLGAPPPPPPIALIIIIMMFRSYIAHITSKWRLYVLEASTGVFIPFCLTMLKNRTQIARESITKT